MKRNGPKGNRAVLAKQAAEFRAQGLLLREIAERLAISISYAQGLVNDPDGTKAKARKDSYRGVCVGCGKPTNGSNGRSGAPDYCAACYPQSPEGQAIYKERTIWTREVIIDRIREWAATHGEPPAMRDWDPTGAERMGDYGRALRFDLACGYWPWFMRVVAAFGSWNAGIQAAGFTARSPHGGDGNQHRKRLARERAA